MQQGGPALARAALSWLAEARDGQGTWGTTQATVLALKAMVVAAERPASRTQRREIEVRLGGKVVRRVSVEADQADVVQMVDLSGLLAGAGAALRLEITELTGEGTGYQVLLRHHEVAAPADGGGGPLSVDVVYSAEEVRVGEDVVAEATVRNASGKTMPMVLLQLPVPPGFAVRRGDFEEHVAAGRIAKFEVGPRTVDVYLRGIPAGETVRIDYRLNATMPVEVDVPGATASEYYDPSVRAASTARRLKSGA